jgi:hypothetical protein
MASTDTIPSTPYNPDSSTDRHALAVVLLGVLTDAGFTAQPRGYMRETVCTREIPGTRITVQVYTTIVGGAGGLPTIVV